MSRTPILLVLVALTLGGAPSVAAHAQTAGQRATRPTASAQAVDDMRTALYQLVTSEETYSDKHNSYSTSLDTVFANEKHAIPKGVTLTIMYASAHGWQASAVHRNLPGKSCVIFFGFLDLFPLGTTAQGQQLTESNPGLPLCDQ